MIKKKNRNPLVEARGFFVAYMLPFVWQQSKKAT